MSYQNFKPTVWAEAIERELARKCVFRENTNQKWEGKVSNRGDSVKILGVGKPTITTVVGTDGDITLPNAEKVPDTSVTMLIDHISYFNYAVGDIDKQQAVGGIMEALSAEASLGTSCEMDKCIADMAKDKSAKKLDASAQTLTSANILAYIDRGVQYLYENDVPTNDTITLTAPPWFYTLFKQAYVSKDTSNSEILKNGVVAKYSNVILKLSNNVAKDASNNSLIQLKTDRAIGFANPLVHTEAYRPDPKFEDAVKGFVLYGAKLVRPKEMVVLNCKA